ncbi:MAG: OmpA family protein [Pseudomonadota bacterium]
MRAYILILTILLSSPALAQDNVEINLDTLEGYSPPPMFETPAPVADEKPRRSVEILAAPVIVPKPARKPAYSGPLIGRNAEKSIDLDEAQIVLQSAQDILRQIEGKEPLPKEPALEPVAEEIVAAPPTEPARIKNKSSLNAQESFELVLPFAPNETALMPEHQTLLAQQILIRLQKYDDIKLEIRAFASAPEHQKSAARRLSLARALAVRDFLKSRNIPQKDMYLRPLGQSSENNSDYVALILSRS